MLQLLLVSDLFPVNLICGWSHNDLLFTGSHTLKSSGAPSVKTTKIVAVAQSKLTFIKPAQTGNW